MIARMGIGFEPVREVALVSKSGAADKEDSDSPLYSRTSRGCFAYAAFLKRWNTQKMRGG
jgi:hypothetical protein